VSSVHVFTDSESLCILALPNRLMLEGDGFLAIDEVDGAVYKVPMESLAVVLHPAMRLEQRRWENTFVNSCKDSTCFVNAETIAWTCNQKHPCLVFKSVSNDVYVYAHNVEVFSQDAPTTTMGTRFVWPMSYHGHYCSWSKVLDRGLPALEGFPPMRKCDPLAGAPDDEVEQRPRPRSIYGAVRLNDPGSTMSISDRVFFLEAITGRFVFRDATECIDSFVRHTRHRKETYPDRMRLNSQIHLCKQLQRDAYCDKMKKRAREDPSVYHYVKLRATHGIKFLASLQKAPDVSSTSSTTSTTKSKTCSHLYSVGQDALCMIIEHRISNILKTPNASQAAACFVALLSVDHMFNEIAISIASRLLAGAKQCLSDFLCTGCAPKGSCFVNGVVEKLPWLTYSRFACSPSLLLRLRPSNVHMHYFRMRMKCQLEPNVSLARAHARGAPSPCTLQDECASENGIVPSTKVKSPHSFEFCNPTGLGAMPMRIIQLYNIANGTT